MKRLAPLAVVFLALGCSSSSDDADDTSGPANDTGGTSGSGGSSAQGAAGNSGGASGKSAGGSAGHAGAAGASAGHANGGASGASGGAGGHAGKSGSAGESGGAGAAGKGQGGAASGGKAGAPSGGNGGAPGQGGASGANPAGGQTQATGGSAGTTGTSGSGGNAGDTGTSGSGGNAGDTGTSGSGGNAGDTGTSGSGGIAGTTGTAGAGGVAGSTGTGGQGGKSQGTVTFHIDVSKGPARQFQPPAKPAAVSPYVYGINGFAAWNNTTKWGMARQGGDAFTDWNWTNNFSNSAADYCFWQGQEDGGAKLAGAITNADYSIPVAQAHGVAYLATAPIVDFVSSGLSNNTGINNLCPGNPGCQGGNGYAVNSGNIVFATTNANSKSFVKNAPTKGSAFCTCDPNGACPSGCKVSNTGTVYQDEMANYLKATYGSGGAPIFFSLDNEPNFWPSTHPEVWPTTSGSPGCGTDGTVKFDDIVSRNVTYASALKGAWPETKVFGPVVAQDGIIYAHSYSDPNLPTTFTDYYLTKLAAASKTAGKALLDAYDVHYYTVGSGDTCLQTPRMFWDPNLTSLSAAQTDALDFGWSGQNDFFDKSLYPRQMIPRLLGKISTAYGASNAMAPGLSFSEYNAGCETAIEGGVAQADLLGIFGREGVFAASAWPLQAITNNNKLTNFLVAAFDLYRNYDGKGGVVGDLTVEATTTDVDNTSVYAFAHTGDAGAVDVVALNKTSTATVVTIEIASGPALSTAALYQLVSTQIAVVSVASPPTLSCAAGSCTFDLTMPPKSATTLILR